jgi:trans-aconitate 2-methyltransferase
MSAADPAPRGSPPDLASGSPPGQCPGLASGSPPGGATRDWDAGTYDRVSDVQLAWALEQLSRVTFAGDEVVLDAGCGSGRVTALLADRVPRGRVYGVDVAPSMVAHAQQALGARARILCQDLVELALPEPVDLAFSNATFHWIPDHDALFAALYRSLRPGGRLVAQCGGRGNIDRFRDLADAVAGEPEFSSYFVGWRRPWNYAGDAETAQRLERAGFDQVSCWLQPRDVTPPEPRAFVQTVCLVRHLDPLPESLRAPFVDRVLERCGEPLVLDYVRLNMTARRR